MSSNQPHLNIDTVSTTTATTTTTTTTSSSSSSSPTPFSPARTRKHSMSTSVPSTPLSPRQINEHHLHSDETIDGFHDVVWEAEEAELTGDRDENMHILKNRYLQVGISIFGWYCFSLTISLYNNWMFDKKSLNLPFPILITSLHQLVLSLLAYLTLYLRPSLVKANQSHAKFDMRYFITRLFPCSLSSALDIGAANMSLRYIPLSIYTMIKSSSIAFVLFFGILTKLEKFSIKLLLIVLVMTVGVTLMAQKDHSHSSDETDKEKSAADYLFGSVMVVFSAMMSGLRWVLTQLLIIKNDETTLHDSDDEFPRKKKGKTHPVVTISQLAPSMFAVLFVFGVFFEGIEEFVNNDIWKKNSIIHNLVLLLSPGVLVFFMTFFEFRILSLSHVLTLSIFGILKEILTILFSVMIFKDRLSGINLIGLAISLGDVIWYNYFRYMEKIEEGETAITGGNGRYQEIELEERL